MVWADKCLFMTATMIHCSHERLSLSHQWSTLLMKNYCFLTGLIKDRLLAKRRGPDSDVSTKAVNRALNARIATICSDISKVNVVHSHMFLLNYHHVISSVNVKGVPCIAKTMLCSVIDCGNVYV